MWNGIGKHCFLGGAIFPPSFLSVSPHQNLFSLITIGIELGVRQLKAFRISDLVKGKTSRDSIPDKALYFQATYESILDLVCYKKEPSKTTQNESTAATRKRSTTSLHSESSAKKARTSHQATTSKSKAKSKQPENPASPTSPASGLSQETSDEDLTRTFVTDFVRDTLRCLQSKFRTFPWLDADASPHISRGYKRFPFKCQ